jgi:hypothetical protein
MDWQALSVLAKQAWRNRARMEVRIWRRKAIWLGSGAVKLQSPHTFCCPSPRARPHCPTSRTAARSRCGAVLSLFVTAFGVAPRAHRAAARICRSRGPLHLPRPRWRSSGCTQERECASQPAASISARRAAVRNRFVTGAQARIKAARFKAAFLARIWDEQLVQSRYESAASHFA